MKKIIVILIVVVLIGLVVYFLRDSFSYQPGLDNDQDSETEIDQPEGEDQAGDAQDGGQQNEGRSVIGRSVEGREINAYHYGTGDTELLFIGGVHGGYSWSTNLVAYELIDYLEENSDVVPSNLRVTIIPTLNPDGLHKIFGTAGRFTQADMLPQDETVLGRFNANNVDLNRNFDCDWQSTGTWQNTSVDGGSEAFSEPESKALKNYIDANNPDAVIVWYSAAGGVFSSSCHNGILSETKAITNVYANASGYQAYESFDFYEITGDLVNWLAKNDIPAISVLLSTHSDIEWTKNLAGIEALFEHYAQ